MADAIWDTCKINATEPTDDVHYVLDCGGLIHQIPWPKGFLTYKENFILYADYVSNTTRQVLSLKDMTHLLMNGFLPKETPFKEPPINYLNDNRLGTWEHGNLDLQSNRPIHTRLHQSTLQATQTKQIEKLISPYATRDRGPHSHTSVLRQH